VQKSPGDTQRLKATHILHGAKRKICKRRYAMRGAHRQQHGKMASTLPLSKKLSNLLLVKIGKGIHENGSQFLSDLSNKIRCLLLFMEHKMFIRKTSPTRTQSLSKIVLLSGWPIP
jgi:hypothetical protein